MTISATPQGLLGQKRSIADNRNILARAGYLVSRSDQCAVLTIRTEKAGRKILAEINRDGLSHDPVARILVDAKIGAAYMNGGTKELKLVTTEPERACVVLANTRGVRKVSPRYDQLQK